MNDYFVWFLFGVFVVTVTSIVCLAAKYIAKIFKRKEVNILKKKKRLNYVEMVKSRNDNYFWRIKYANHEIGMHSEIYDGRFGKYNARKAAKKHYAYLESSPDWGYREV